MTKAHSILAILTMVIVLWQLVSCSGMSPANKSLYALDPCKSGAPSRDQSSALPASSVAMNVSRDQVLQVRRVNILAPFNGLALVYRTKGGTYVRDFYNQWISPPEELFSGALVDDLSKSGVFASVVDGRSSAPHRFALEVCVTSLCGDFQDSQHPKAVLSARVYLLDDSAVGRRVAYQSRQEITIPLVGASAQDLVLGTDRAYRQLLESTAQDLSAYVTTTTVQGHAR